MKIINKKRSRTLLGLVVVLLLTVTCSCPIQFPFPRSTPTPTPTPTPIPVLADYGDAPDGDQNMDTGYYGLSGGPWVFTYGNAGISAGFPTMGEDPVPGAFTNDVDQFWIGPLYSGSNLADTPSREDDADDPLDPDRVPNLQTPGGRADCDKENGTHDPASTGCMPVPPWSIPMNARISIFFGYPPLGVWLTAAHASENMTYDGPIYWNLAIDLNQSGAWDSGDEWVVRDEVFYLGPGETEVLLSPAFRVPASGMPWGRINFPFWVRSMVTSESVKDKLGSGNWDGRGPEEGFAVGEVEDYFVEWRPIGQILPNPPPPQPIQENGCGVNAGELFSDTLIGSDFFEIEPGDGVDSLQIFGVEGTEGFGEVFSTEMLPLDLNGSTPFSVGGSDLVVTIDNRYVRVDGDVAEEGVRLIAIPGLMDPGECSGTGPVGTGGDYWQTLSLIPPEEDGLFEPYSVRFVYHFGCPDNNKLVDGESITEITVQEGSIKFTGDPPFINVSGELNPEDGTFYAEGTGEVAGFQNITATFEGTLTEAGLTGQYTMGAKGGLPGGNSVTYQVSGTRAGESGEAEEPPATGSPGVTDAIDAFIQAFNGAFQDGDSDPLYQLLNPAVIDLYGEEVCRAHLGEIIQTPTSLEYLDSTRVGVWDWELDGVITPVDFAYAVQLNYTSQGQTTKQEVHLTLPGDNSVRWFTDCGDPLP